MENQPDPDDWMTVRSTPTEKEAFGPLDERRTITTREGTVVAEEGDYIIKVDDGNVYPISPDKFEEYYEVIGEEADEDDDVDGFESASQEGT